MRFKRKMKSESKLNSKHLFELASLEINALWIMQNFLILPNYISNFNIGTVLAIQKIFVQPHEMSEQIKSSRYCS